MPKCEVTGFTSHPRKKKLKNVTCNKTAKFLGRRNGKECYVCGACKGAVVIIRKL